MATPGALFSVFVRVAFRSVGGGGAAHVREAIVEGKKWLSAAEFNEALVTAQCLPGMNLTNLASLMGGMLGGPVGAVAATTAVVLPALVLSLAVAAISVRFGSSDNPALRSFLRGLAAGAIGLTAALVYRTARSGVTAWPAAIIALTGFGLVVYGLHAGIVLLVLVPLSVLATRGAQT